MELKDKAVTVHATQAYRGRRGVLLLILDLDTIRKWENNFTPQPHHCQERTLAPTERRLGEPQNQFRHSGEKSLAPVRICTLDQTAHGLVTIPTTVPWLWDMKETI